MAEPTDEKFLSECRTIVQALGREDAKIAARAQMAWGLNIEGARCYRDKLIEIVAEAGPSKRLLITRLETNNPIFFTDTGGVVRWHGEARKLAAHVHLLAVGLQED